MNLMKPEMDEMTRRMCRRIAVMQTAVVVMQTAVVVMQSAVMLPSAVMQIAVMLPSAVMQIAVLLILVRYTVICCVIFRDSKVMAELAQLARSIVGSLCRKTRRGCFLPDIYGSQKKDLQARTFSSSSLICTLLYRLRILSKEGFLSKPGKIDIINPVVAGKMDIINPVAANGKMNMFYPVAADGKMNMVNPVAADGKMNMLIPVLLDPAEKDRLKMKKMKGSSSQHRSQNQRAELEGLLSEPGNIYAANARVVTPSRKLEAVELIAVNVYDENVPSVVLISNMARQDKFHLAEQSYGTGFVWDDKGHIVTNFHVICGAYVLRVIFDDESACEARVIGCHPDTDIAVLSIVDLHKLKKLRPVRVGSSRNLSVGQNAYAIGNPFRLQSTLTTGAIGALGRQIKSSTTGCPIPDVIQTTTAINPGNSGGPLFESSGSLIGINTSFHSPPGASGGIAFAIPVDTVSSIVDQLVKNESVMRDPYCTRSISGAAWCY